MVSCMLPENIRLLGQIKNLISHSTTGNRSITYVSAPHIPRRRCEGASGNTVCTGFAAKPRNWELGGSISFMQTCFLPWKQTRLFPSRLLSADTDLLVALAKSGQDLAFFAGTLRAHGLWWNATSKVLWCVILIIQLAAIYWASSCCKHSICTQCSLICIPLTTPVQCMTASAAAAAKLLQSCPTLCDSIDSSPPGSTILGFSRQEHWSGLPFPSPMHESEKWKRSRSVVSDSHDPMDCSPPGSSTHGIFQARVLEWGAIACKLTCKELKQHYLH